jgi:hypothetical protein
VHPVYRDPAYLIGLAVVTGVLVFAVAFGSGSSSGASGSSAADRTAPAGAAVPANTPTREQAILDSRRAFDLKRDAAALELYRARFGSYPSSDNEFTHLCKLAFDPGCQLLSVTQDFASEDELYPYWYRSDGAGYTIFAETETVFPNNNCPTELPPLLTDVPVLCVHAGEGTQ